MYQEQLKTPKGDSLDYAVHLAARKGDNDLIKTFIEMGAEVDIQNVSSLVWIYLLSYNLIIMIIQLTVV